MSAPWNDDEERPVPWRALVRKLLASPFVLVDWLFAMGIGEGVPDDSVEGVG